VKKRDLKELVSKAQKRGALPFELDNDSVEKYSDLRDSV